MISRVLSADLPEHIGERVTIAGWLHRRRDLAPMIVGGKGVSPRSAPVASSVTVRSSAKISSRPRSSAIAFSDCIRSQPACATGGVIAGFDPATLIEGEVLRKSRGREQPRSWWFDTNVICSKLENDDEH